MSYASIYKDFGFESAHFLPNVPEGHKCKRMHGHSFKVRVTVCGKIGPDTGWIIDFADIKKAWKPLEEQLDHNLLNDIKGLSNPTSENLARWIWFHLSKSLEGLSQVEVKETCNSGCIFCGPAYETTMP